MGTILAASIVQSTKDTNAHRTMPVLQFAQLSVETDSNTELRSAIIGKKLVAQTAKFKMGTPALEILASYPNVYPSKCGDMIKAGQEKCDNGNKAGCTNCQIDSGYACKLATNGGSYCYKV